MSRTVASLKFGEWVLRQRKSDKLTVSMRVYEAIDELARILPASEYPSRLAIAEKLATGKPLDAGEYEYQLAD
jgi:hypothetical protein